MIVEELRPKNLSEVVGLRAQLAALEKLYKADKAPTMFCLSGEPGSGKTTLARILGLAAKLKVDPFDIDMRAYNADIVQQVNAATENGIDGVRAMIQASQYGQMDGSASVVILNEAQQLTKQAQKGLLDFTEFPPGDFSLILTTSDLGAIDKALVERFYQIVTRPLASADVQTLVTRGLKHLGSKEDGKKITETLLANGILFPRSILNNVERVHYGADLVSIADESTNAFAAVQDLCRGGATGSIFAYLKSCTVAEAKSLRFLILSYLSTMNFGGSGKAADAILKITGPVPYEDAAFKPWLGASIRLVGRVFGGGQV